MQAVGALVFAAAVAAALLGGPLAVAIVVVVAAMAVLLDFTLLLGRAGAKPILPVAAVPAVALPVLVAFDPSPSGAAWARVPEFYAVAVLGGFLLVLVFGRRRNVTSGLGVTFAVGLFVGLGAAGLLLLYGLGATWLVALVVVALAADLAGPLAGAALQRSDEASRELAQTVPLIAAVVAVVVASAALAVLVPMEWATAGLLGAAAAVAALGGEHLREVLTAEAGVGSGGPVFGGGVVVGAVDALFLSAPVAYVLARAAVL
jgi:hypothetical protein